MHVESVFGAFFTFDYDDELFWMGYLDHGSVSRYTPPQEIPWEITPGV